MQINTTNGVVAFKNRTTRNNFCPSFSSPLQRVVPNFFHPRSTIHLSGPHKNIPHEFHAYLLPQTKRGCTSKIRCDYQGSGVSNALLCGCKNCAGYWLLLLLVNQFSTLTWTRIDGHKREKRAKICILNGTIQLFFGSWCMYGEVDKMKLGKTSFPNWRNILSQNKQYLL